MSQSEATRPELHRKVGFVSLTLIAAGGILGSGWLFSPLQTAQQAGPASIISWVIGAAAMLLIAFCFAEIASVLPVAGGIARIPRFTHGDLTAGVIGWTAWVGYCSAAPIESAVVIRYLSQTWPDLVLQTSGGALSQLGFIIAAAMLLFFVVINAVGVAFFAKANSVITVMKFVFPVIIAVTFLITRFEPGNFTNHGGFMPYGWHGVLSAVSTGGIIFALIGFRHAIDMAGEARNPSRTVPWALIFGLLLPLLIYVGLQVAFIGALSSDDLKNGWRAVEDSHALGPLAGVSITLGIGWLTAVIYGGAVMGPAGGALVSTGSNARLAFALSRNRFLPRIFERLSRRGIPVNALVLNFVVGYFLLVILNFDTIVAINSAAIVLSFAIGPVAVVALRRQMPNAPRLFRIPASGLISTISFTISSLIVYWSDWTSMKILLIIIVVAIVTMLVSRLIVERKSWRTFDLREAIWLIPYIASLTIVSALGNFGGTRSIPFGWDMAILSVLALINFRIATWCALDHDTAEKYREIHMPPVLESRDTPP